MFNPPDILDQAALATERATEQAIANRVVYTGVSAEFCADCDDEIEAGRRAAVPGCTRCTSCENIFQKRKAGGRV